jgi:hypothetical protein
MLFTGTHLFAIQAALYWHIWWFDLFMHFWGGTLLALGLHALATLPRVPLRPGWTELFLLLLLATSTWEVFEWWVGLFDPTSHL